MKSLNSLVAYRSIQDRVGADEVGIWPSLVPIRFRQLDIERQSIESEFGVTPGWDAAEHPSVTGRPVSGMSIRASMTVRDVASNLNTRSWQQSDPDARGLRPTRDKAAASEE